MNLIEKLKPELEKLINQNLNLAKKIAIDEAWKILQLSSAIIVQKIEHIAESGTKGKDKKTAALAILSQFYDNIFIVIDIPFVPNVLEPIIHKSVKHFLMILVGSSIDALVTTFRNIGVFSDPNSKIDVLKDSKPKVSDK